MLALPRLSSPGIEPRRTDGALGANLPYLHNSTAVTAKPPGSTLLELVEVDSGMAHCGEVDLVHVVHQHCPAADVVRNFEMRAAETSVGHLHDPGLQLPVLGHILVRVVHVVDHLCDVRPSQFPQP